ncbi:MAG: hypothetical protein IJA10_14595 [Lachnospiraceae bacterium]|nr:hypothetical protein [Lachnospiraceae bacterium]
MNMEFCKEDWIGVWDNFESYLYSEEEMLVHTWEQVEEACKAVPALQAMFQGGAKDFWKRACRTQTEENPVMLGKIKVEGTEEGICILFLNSQEEIVGKCSYILLEKLEKGLEGKENLLFFAENVEEECPFRYLLAMNPMPNPATRKKDEVLSHFHFQFASRKEKLITDGKLLQPGWYATMCEGESSEVEKCNVVRALHRMPVIEMGKIF